MPTARPWLTIGTSELSFCRIRNGNKPTVDQSSEGCPRPRQLWWYLSPVAPWRSFTWPWAAQVDLRGHDEPFGGFKTLLIFPSINKWLVRCHIVHRGWNQPDYGVSINWWIATVDQQPQKYLPTSRINNKWRWWWQPTNNCGISNTRFLEILEAKNPLQLSTVNPALKLLKWRWAGANRHYESWTGI